MRPRLLAKAVVPFVALLAFTAPAGAVSYFDASLTGAQETSPTGSSGTGYGTVELNDAMNLITVNLSFSSLTSNAVAGHIHGPAPLGTNATVIFPLTGLPSATSGSIPAQSFAITSAQVADLQGGLMYFNIHTSNFPGGEIRGQIRATTAPIPEPGSMALLLSALPGAMLALRARRSRTVNRT